MHTYQNVNIYLYAFAGLFVSTSHEQVNILIYLINRNPLHFSISQYKNISAQDFGILGLGQNSPLMSKIFCIQGYNFLTGNTRWQSGDLTLCVKDTLGGSIRYELSFKEIFLESFFVEFTYNSESISVGIVYRKQKQKQNPVLSSPLNIKKRKEKKSG